MHRKVDEIFPGDSESGPLNEKENRQVRDVVHYIARHKVQLDFGIGIATNMPVKMTWAGIILVSGIAIGLYMKGSEIGKIIKLLGLG